MIRTIYVPSPSGPQGGASHSRQAKRAKSRQRQESVGLKPNAELKKDAKAPS